MEIDFLKWIVGVIGASVSFVASFYVIDYCKLRLERFRATAEHQRQLLDAYLKATETPQPDVWVRKLHVLTSFATDESVRKWAQVELVYIQEFAALDALYRETLKIASQLVDPSQLNSPERGHARIRYDQLYWADLPFAGESQAVIEAMISFRSQLMKAERAGASAETWDGLYGKLIKLSEALKESVPRYPVQHPTPPAAKEKKRKDRRP